MSEHLVPFLFDGELLVRTVVRGGEPWFVAADVARVLGFRDAENATRGLDDDEKGTQITSTLGGDQRLLIVSESGLYALIFRSRKPKAVEFRKWVTSEVLPALRQTGSYEMGQRAATIEPPPQHPEHREFPDWPMDEMRTKGRVVDLYRLTYGQPSAQWIMPQLGFPTPPKALITEGRQLELFTETANSGAAASIRSPDRQLRQNRVLLSPTGL